MKPNLIIAAIGLLIPILAEFISPETGLGFDVLLYWPFDFAYVLLVGVLFVAANLLIAKATTTLGSVMLGISFWVGWFLVSFLAVSQLHLSLGYKL